MRNPMLLAAGLCVWSFASPALSQDAGNADESPTLKRIFANWNAREQRVKSCYFQWDERTTVQKGFVDPLDDSDRGALGEDRHYEEHGTEIWIEGNDHLCLVHHEWARAPHDKSTDKAGFVARSAFDGTLDSIFLWPQSRTLTFAPRGTILKAKEQNYFLGTLVPLLLSFRPQHPWIKWKLEDSRIVTQNAIIDGVHCVKIARSVNAYGFSGTDTCWVDPRRDDVVVRWELRRDGRNSYPNYRGSADYQRDQSYGWIPRSWRSEDVGSAGRNVEMTVTHYKFNDAAPAGTFAPAFPIGTLVSDRANGRAYVVQPDGTQRTVSWEELRRLGQPKVTRKE